MSKPRFLFLLLLMAGSLGWAAEAETPSLELLEFLAEGSVVDGLWSDPLGMLESAAASGAGRTDEEKTHD